MTLTHTETCTRCRGTGVDPGFPNRDCNLCDGTGGELIELACAGRCGRVLAIHPAELVEDPRPTCDPCMFAAGDPNSAPSVGGYPC